MAYQPSIDDVPDNQTSQGYQPSLDDISDDKWSQINKFLSPQRLGGAPSSGLTSSQALESQSRGFMAGLVDLGRGLANLLPKVEESAAVQKTYEPITAEQMGETKILPADMAKTPEAQRGFLYGQVAPTLAIPLGEGGALAKGGKAFLTSEALSPVYNPDKSLSESLKEGLEPSAVAGAIEPGLAGAKKLTQGLLTMGGTASSEEFAKNVAATEGKPVATPELSRAPRATKFEQNVLGNIPFSGVEQRNMEVGQKLDSDVSDVLSNLNKVPEDKPTYRYMIDPETGQYSDQPVAVKKQTQQEKIANNFKKNVSKNEQIKRDLYGKRDEEAKNTEGNFIADSRKSTADQYLNSIQNEIDEKGFTTVSQDTLKELGSASKNNPVDFSRLNFNRKAYSDMSDQFARNGNLYESKIMGDLERSYNDDIKNAIDKSGNESLKQAQKQADFHFKDKIVPIRDDQKLFAQSKGFGNPNAFIRDTLSEGRYEDPSKIDIVLKNLDPEFKDQYAHEVLTRGSKEILGQDELGSDSVLSVYNKLGDESKRLMFKPSDRKTLDKGVKTRELMGQSINAMLNPKTGYSHGAALGWGSYAALSGALAHQLMGMGLNAPEAYMLGGSLIGGMGKGLSSYLASDVSKSAYKAGAKLRESKPTKMPANIGLLLQSNKESDNE